MKTYGLIGKKLGHSFSKGFFTEKFEKENLSDHEYINFELDTIDDFPIIFGNSKQICGLNCTIPYKQQVMQYLDEVDDEAAAIGAVNTIKIYFRGDKQILKGFNTDLFGFENSLLPMLKEKHKKALILGTGGASKAVKYFFEKRGISYLSATTKEKTEKNEISYNQLTKPIMADHLIIVNATPLGMYPNIDTYPYIPYDLITPDHILYDLVYNPQETLFLKKGAERGAKTKNGLEMLHLQALRAWEIWNR
jgi:Shikimate 5-dehydrogenase